MKVTSKNMEPIAPGNPYLSDPYNMGQQIGEGVELMYGNHSTQKVEYLILVDKVTGERVRITIDREGE